MSTVETNQQPAVLKNSAAWCVLKRVNVLDADGWDRTNFDASWAEEITEAEFDRRLQRSTTLLMPEVEDAPSEMTEAPAP